LMLGIMDQLRNCARFLYIRPLGDVATHTHLLMM
jgi:hypothetical protein